MQDQKSQEMSQRIDPAESDSYPVESVNWALLIAPAILKALGAGSS